MQVGSNGGCGADVYGDGALRFEHLADDGRLGESVFSICTSRQFMPHGICVLCHSFKNHV